VNLDIIVEAFSKNVIQTGYRNCGMINDFGLPDIEKMMKTCTTIKHDGQVLIRKTFSDIHRQYVHSIREDTFDKMGFPKDIGLSGNVKERSNEADMSRQRAVILTRASMIEDKKRRRREEKMKEQKKMRQERSCAAHILECRTKFIEKVKKAVLKRFDEGGRRHNRLSWYKHVKKVDLKKINSEPIAKFLKACREGRIPTGRKSREDMAVTLLRDLNRKCRPLEKYKVIAEQQDEPETMDIDTGDDETDDEMEEVTSDSTIIVGCRVKDIGEKLLKESFEAMNLTPRYKKVLSYPVFVRFCCHFSKRMKGWIHNKADQADLTHPSLQIPRLNIPMVAADMMENEHILIPDTKKWGDADLTRCILCGPVRFVEFDDNEIDKWVNKGAVYLEFDTHRNKFFRIGQTIDITKRKTGTSGHDKRVRTHPLTCRSYATVPHEDNEALCALTTSRYSDVKFYIAKQYDSVAEKFLMNEKLMELWDFTLPLRRSEQTSLVSKGEMSAHEKGRVLLYAFELAYACCQSDENLNDSPGFESYRTPPKSM